MPILQHRPRADRQQGATGPNQWWRGSRWNRPGTYRRIAAPSLLRLHQRALTGSARGPRLAEMSGAEVVSGPGDPDGTGTAMITTDRQAGTVCAVIHTEDVTEEEPYNPVRYRS
jgi:hypothetical protein